MSVTSDESKPFIHVEVLDFTTDPVLVKEAVDYYCSLKPERAVWPHEMRARVAIRTECRWGRVPIGESLYMVSEFGDGPRSPLSRENVATVTFFAELRPSSPGASDGYLEQTPFCHVEFTDENCRRLRAQGLVRLEEFIRRTVPECARALEEWLSILSKAKQRLVEIKTRSAQKARTPATLAAS